MKRLTAILAAMLWIGSAQAAPINGSFETGDLTGWLTNPFASAVTGIGGQTPTDGNYMAWLLPQGPGDECSGFGIDPNLTNCAFILQFTALQGETIHFDWNFYDGDPADAGNFPDPAIYVISDSGNQLLADASQTDIGFTGWSSASYYVSTGQSTIGFLVANYGDTLYDSGLLIDNVRVPEPGTLALLGLGLLGLGFSRKRVG